VLTIPYLTMTTPFNNTAYCNECKVYNNITSNFNVSNPSLNCTPAALLLATWSGKWLLDYDLTLDFVRSIDGPGISKLNAVPWFMCSLECNTSIATAALRYAQRNCSTQICQAYDWEGNSDIAGVGVSSIINSSCLIEGEELMLVRWLSYM
jgi:hypothetical protein